MKFATLTLVGLAAASMERLMELKQATRDRERAQGMFNPGKFKKVNQFKPCINGKAGEFSCKGISQFGFLSHEDLQSTSLEGNDVWGWTDPKSGREFGAVGQTDGTAFVEVTKTGRLEYLGRLPASNNITSIWRDMKEINGYMYIGADSSPRHGVQVFDMRKLLKAKPQKPEVYDTEDLTDLYTGFGSSHNIVAHAATNFIYAVGTARNTTRRLPTSPNYEAPNQCNGGLWMLDVSDPSNVKSPGCYFGDGYTHDAQVVIYKGPDSRYKGREIAFAYNEDSLTIVDVTNKANPVLVGKKSYQGVAYAHQGWLLDDKMEYLLLDDELDEVDGTQVPAPNGRTTTYIFDIKDLTNPVNTGFFQSSALAIDHNQYVINGLAFQANYGSGLRVKDVRSIPRDPTGGSVTEVAFFDTHPEDDATNGSVDFVGSWSSYPYFPSGYILVNDIERGCFSLKRS